MGSSVRIAEGAVVCDGAMLTGDITIGSETIVFPGAKIECLEGAGPIVIGRGCVVEEGVSVVNMEPEEMNIGDGNLFEVGCTVCAQQVGDYNVFQPKCEVGQEVTVSSGCLIGPTVMLDIIATLENSISLYRSGGGQPDEYSIKRRPRNLEMNRAQVKSYRTALASQGKKYYLGKYNKIMPSTATAEGI